MAATSLKRRPGRPPMVSNAPPMPPQPGLSAEGYLEQVVSGTLPADPSRVRAALGLIRFQAMPKRAPLPSPSAADLQIAETYAVQRAKQSEFDKKADAIRARHNSKKGL